MRGVHGRDVMGCLFMHGTILFFLELAATQGWLLQIDDCTINKYRMDYARFLIATPMLKEINVTEDVWIDGRSSPISIIEDVEFGFAEDACLVEYENDNNSQCSISEGFKEDEPLVDALVKQIHDDCVLKTTEDNEVQSNTINQQPLKLQLDTVQVVTKDFSSSLPINSVAETSKGTAKVKPCNSNTSQHVRKRRKVVLSVNSLKKIARLSATDRNALIRSLNPSPHQVIRKGSLCLLGRVLLLTQKIGSIGLRSMVMLRGWRLIL